MAIKGSKTKELRDRAIAWARARGLDLTGSPVRQALKLKEEAEEAGAALDEVLSGRSPIDALMMEIGDVQVVLTILCDLAQVDQDQCLEMALKKIESRTGRVVDGVFVKDVGEDNYGQIAQVQ